MTTPSLDRLLAVMRKLRDPNGGCPWDVEQTFETIAPYTIEEAYEVADAIAQGDRAALREELGDLLFQVVYHTQIAAEGNHFTFEDVAAGIADKMISRHPHVFGTAELENAAAQTTAWEAIKEAERSAKAAARGRQSSVLDNVPLSLPALTRAAKLQKRAARVGFDWPEVDQVLDKLDEEIGELRAEMTSESDAAAREDEMGDLLFTLVNLARHLQIDPETALRGANRKFERRFRQLEQHAAETGKSAAELPLDELEVLWQRVKASERPAG